MFLAEWARRIWYLLNRRRLERDLRHEMEAHRAMMGQPAGFGNTLRLREEASDVWGWAWLDLVVALLIVLTIGRTGWRIVRQASETLADRVAVDARGR